MKTVTVKALANLADDLYPECPLQDGHTAEVSEAVAARMVARRHGVILKAPPVPAEIKEPPKAPAKAKTKEE